MNLLFAELWRWDLHPRWIDGLERAASAIILSGRQIDVVGCRFERYDNSKAIIEGIVSVRQFNSEHPTENISIVGNDFVDLDLSTEWALLGGDESSPEKGVLYSRGVYVGRGFVKGPVFIENNTFYLSQSPPDGCLIGLSVQAIPGVQLNGNVDGFGEAVGTCVG